jgi:hypothetical protein
VAFDNSMCPGSTQPLKNEHQDTPGGKDGRCVRLTTYHHQVPMLRNPEALTSQNPPGPIGLHWECFTVLLFVFSYIMHIVAGLCDQCIVTPTGGVVDRKYTL